MVAQLKTSTVQIKKPSFLCWTLQILNKLKKFLFKLIKPTPAIWRTHKHIIIINSIKYEL